MAYLGNAPARSFISFERQVFTIVNSQTAYTLSHSVNNENDIRLVINNIVQEPGSGKAYTASGTTLTLSAALTNGTDEMYCVFLGRATATNAPGAGSVNTAAITDLNVTTAKIAADAITEAKIADDAVESEHLNDNVISGQTELAAEPADTDEFLVSDAGTLKRIDYSLIKGVGQILQVVNTSLIGSEAQTTSTSFQDTNLNATITPSSSSNKVLILVTSTGRCNDSAGTSVYTIARGSTNLGSSDGMNRINQPADNELMTPIAMHFLDSPSTTSATTYRPQLRSTNSSNTAYFGEGNSNQVITLFEVKG